MIDFHSHILPNMDDGPDNVETSLEMLRQSKKQGIDVIFSTSHYYATDESPDSFLERRDKSCEKLKSSMSEFDANDFPRIILGAEILFFPGMGDVQKLKSLSMGNTGTIMIEPPMHEWTDSMLDEIEYLGKQIKLVPIIAHVDRYMRLIDDESYIDKVIERKMVVQCNASFFLHSDSKEFALKCLSEGKIHLLGSDCHSMGRRCPNLNLAADVIRNNGQSRSLGILSSKCYRLVEFT